MMDNKAAFIIISNTAEHIIPEAFKEAYEKAKWSLWHGGVNKSLSKLADIKKQMNVDQKKINVLITYIKNNQERPSSL